MSSSFEWLELETLSRDIAITHLSTRSYPSGLVTSEYAVAAAA